MTSKRELGIQNLIPFTLSRMFFFLFGLMLYVHGKQLMSCRDGQLSYSHCFWASLPEAGYQYLTHIISPLTVTFITNVSLKHVHAHVYKRYVNFASYCTALKCTFSTLANMYCDVLL